MEEITKFEYYGIVKPSDVAMQIAARIWCDNDMKHIIMNEEAAYEIARIIDIVIEDNDK